MGISTKSHSISDHSVILPFSNILLIKEISAWDSKKNLPPIHVILSKPDMSTGGTGYCFREYYRDGLKRELKRELIGLCTGKRPVRGRLDVVFTRFCYQPG
jgi:hypothetical protein